MPHSSGVLAGLDEAALKQRIATPPYNTLWQRFTSRTKDVMVEARKGDFCTFSYGALAWHSITTMVVEAALIWRWTQDDDAKQFVEECISAVHDRYFSSKDFSGLPAGRKPVNSHHEIAMAADLCFDDLSDDAQKKLLQLMREVLIDCHDGAEPYTGFSGGGNVPYCATLNAAICAVLWGNACGHPNWRDTVHHAVEYTRCYLKYGCDPGGIGYEGTGYSHSVFHYMFQFVQLAAQTGVVDMYESEPMLKTIIDGTLQLSFPGGDFLINCNDIGLMQPTSMQWLLFTARRYNDPLHLGLWMAYQGPDHPFRPYGDFMPWYRENHLPGDVPIDERLAMFNALLHWHADVPYTPLSESHLPTRVYSPGTETVMWRTSWSDDATYVHIPGAGRSHASQTHRHADSGHFSIFAHGDYLAIDTGRYNVDEDQHSVILVDGECHMPNDGWGMSHRSETKANYQSDESLSYVKVDASHMKDCNWADRHFMFVPIGGDDCYLVIIDNLNKDNEKHMYRWQMQVNPDAELSITGDRTACVTGNNARLDLSFVIPAASNFPDSPHTLKLHQDEKDWGWPYGKEGKNLHPDNSLLLTSALRPRLLADLEGYNGQMVTIVSPRRKSTEPLKVAHIERHRLLDISIDCGGFTDNIIIALDHGYIATEQVKTLTEIVLIRRDSEGRVLKTWTVDDAPVELL